MKKILGSLLIVLILVVAINAWSPWHRQPVIFYEPVILPLEVIRGDIIVLEDGAKLAIDEDKRINSISYDASGIVTINATVKRSLWQLITNSKFCALLILTGCEATNSDTITAPDPEATRSDNSAWYKFKMEALESKR